MPKLRNINPLGHVDVPLLGREGGPTTTWKCPKPSECGPDHEHEEVKVSDEYRGTGCLEPVEVFEVDAETAKQLLEHSESFELVKTEKKG